MAALIKRLLFSTLTLVFALAGASGASAKAAPVRAASTLLSLYTRSDVIAIGRFDKREEFGTNRIGEGFTAVTTRTYFDVSTVLKGEPRKFVLIEDEEFRYQVLRESDGPRQAVFVDDFESFDVEAQPVPGDTVILFLSGSGDSLVLADQRDGVRKISAESQSVIADRIRDLNSIFTSEKVDSAKLASWLVRCIEHPATRWDGTHELLQGLRRSDWESQKDADGYERIDPTVSIKYGFEAAKALDDGMRSSLTQTLVTIGIGNVSSGGRPALSAGDRELIALVKRWDSTSAAGYLLALLRSRAFSFHENSGMMVRVAELLGDGGIKKAAARYANTPDPEPVSDAEKEKASDIDALRAAALDGFIKVACTHLTESVTRKAQ